jgi:hypothetical protein
MPFWVWAVLVVAVLCGAGYVMDLRARRLRAGLTRPAATGTRPAADPSAEAERIQPGATGWVRSDDGVG